MRSVKVHNKGVNAIYKLKCPLNANIFTTEHTWFTIPSTPCNMSCTNNYIRIHRAVQFSVRDRTGPRTDLDRTGPVLIGPVFGPYFWCFLVFGPVPSWTEGLVDRTDGPQK